MKNDMERFTYAMEQLRYGVDRLKNLNHPQSRDVQRKMCAEYAIIALALRD